jgi:hypothetical protein
MKSSGLSTVIAEAALLIEFETELAAFPIVLPFELEFIARFAFAFTTAVLLIFPVVSPQPAKPITARLNKTKTDIPFIPYLLLLKVSENCSIFIHTSRYLLTMQIFCQRIQKLPNSVLLLIGEES